MGPRRVPRNDLAPADRRSRCGQMHHEPRLDPGYLGCDRTQRARGLLALERAGFCVQRGGRKIYMGPPVRRRPLVSGEAANVAVGCRYD